MKLYILSCILGAIVIVECGHTFMGTNVYRPLVYHQNVKISSKLFRKTIEYVNFTMPVLPGSYHRTIQGILAYDLMNSGATANVTQGGIGYNYVSIRMKSERQDKLNYDVYIYA